MFKNCKYFIDAHAHLGYWPTLKSAKDVLIKSTEKNKIDFTLLSFDGSEFFCTRGDKLTSQLIGSKKALHFCKSFPNKFGMLIWVRPNTEKNIEELDSFIKKHRNFIYGIKYHPWCSQLRINSPKVIPYLELARKYDLPVLVHTANDKFSNIKYLERCMDKFPDLTFIAAHCILETDHQKIIQTLKKYHNLYCDTAWVDINFINSLKKEKLMDRVMFGTDNPIDSYRTLDEEIYQNYFNNTINLNKTDYNKLMWKNATLVYKISTKTFKS